MISNDFIPRVEPVDGYSCFVAYMHCILCVIVIVLFHLDIYDYNMRIFSAEEKTNNVSKDRQIYHTKDAVYSQVGFYFCPKSQKNNIYIRISLEYLRKCWSLISS